MPVTPRRGAVVVLGLWLAVAFVAAGTAGVRPAEGGEIIERVLAVAAGDVITVGDVTAAQGLALVTVSPTPPGTPGDDPIRAVLSRLIDRSLMLAEVDRYAPPEPTAAAIDGQVAALQARLGPGVVASVLARAGMDEKDLREILRQNLRIRAYVEQRFTVAPISDDDLDAYYRAHADAFSRAGAVLGFAEARDAVVQAVVGERRQALVDAWVDGLRRRAEITDLYVTEK